MISASEARAITNNSNNMTEKEKQQLLERLQKVEQDIIKVAKSGGSETYFRELPDGIVSLLRTKGYKVENVLSPILEQIGQIVTIVKW